MTTLRFCERRGAPSVKPPTASSGSTQYLARPPRIETHPSVKEMMPIDSNAIIWTMRNAGRGTVPSPTLTANTCMTPLEAHPVTCSISGLSGGSLSRIVTTQVTRPGK